MHATSRRELRLRPYEARDRDSCIALMRATWDFDGLLPGGTGRVSELFFDEAVLGIDYSELVVDAEDRVQGLILGVIGDKAGNPLLRGIRAARFYLRTALRLATGRFGPPLASARRLWELVRLTAGLDGERTRRDAYVSLFIVGEALRGQGLGRRLMDAFQNAAMGARRDRIYLWTDKGCTYQFYDRYGFKRIKELRSEFLHEYGEGPNGFVYAKPLIPSLS